MRYKSVIPSEGKEESRVSRIAITSGHSYFPHLLGSDSVVVDLGGNRGAFSTAIRSRFGCRTLVVEPNPELCDSLSRLGHEAYCLAVTSTDGPVSFYLADNSEASSLLVPSNQSPSGRWIEVLGVRLSRFLREHDVNLIDLLKVDIEGAEIAMFDSLSDDELQRITQISVEFHDFSGLVSQMDVRRIKQRFSDLGFWTLKMFRAGNLDVLFVNRQRTGLSRGELAYTGLCVPLLASLQRGLARIVDRFGPRS